MSRGQAYVVGKKPHSGTIPFLVGPKVVYIHLSCQRFLIELGNMVDITIWSSMRVSTVKFVYDLFFEGLAVSLLIFSVRSLAIGSKSRMIKGRFCT